MTATLHSGAGWTRQIWHGSAYSKRKDSSELALTQAISYAAHMIYKFYEQKTLQESMEGK